jgi:hypothetical protein
MDRHARQTRLVGVGREGQARLAATRAEVPLEGLAGDVAARYLAGAGVALVRVRSDATGAGARAIDASVGIEVSPLLPAELSNEGAAIGLRDPATQQLAGGALFALRALRVAFQGNS